MNNIIIESIAQKQGLDGAPIMRLRGEKSGGDIDVVAFAKRTGVRGRKGKKGKAKNQKDVVGVDGQKKDGIVEEQQKKKESETKDGDGVLASNKGTSLHLYIYRISSFR